MCEVARRLRADARNPTGRVAPRVLWRQISEALATQDVSVKDQGGDGRHVRCATGRACVSLPLCGHRRMGLLWFSHAAPTPYTLSIDVVSTMFEGKSAVDRQRMVYKAIWQELQETVHAVDAMTTKTPAEAGKA